MAAGGRVLSVTALGKTVREAQARAYEAVSRINWPEGFYRQDIGWRDVRRETAGETIDEEGRADGQG
jgi:phosphoribosylamine--glycine ligase